MLTFLLDIFSNFPGERLLTYITFRSFMAILFSFVLGIFFGRKFIKIVFQLRFRDRSREFGDISPRDKDGTPTMGGVFIFLSFLVSLLLWGDLSNFFIQLILFAAFWFTSLGFIDDYLKSVRGSNDAGLSRGWKLLFQSIFGIILAVFGNLGGHNSSQIISLDNFSFFLFPGKCYFEVKIKLWASENTIPT